MSCAIRIPDLDVLLGGVWQALEEAGMMGNHPFRCPVLGTVDADGLPEVRTVVLRGADRNARSLWFATDVRSAKVAQLRARPRASWLFWDAGRRWQVRATSSVFVHHDDDVAFEALASVTDAAVRSVLTSEAPGTPLDAPGDGLADPLQGRALSGADRTAARQQFARVSASVLALDVLQLHDDGHLRSIHEWNGERFEGRWVVP